MDCFSRLPDEILIHILSFLTTNDAAVTSALSTRWEHLWKLTGRLHFSFPLYHFHHEKEQREKLSMVDAILHSFDDPVAFPVHEFHISDGYFSIDVAANLKIWIPFALVNHDVLVLNLSLSPKLFRKYRFPHLPSSKPRSYKLTHLHLSYFRICPYFRGFGNLRSISLESCMVTDATIASINRNCTSLECLKLINVYGLKNLWISTLLCNLKHLEIDCHRLQKLVIDSPSLAFLEYKRAIPAVGHRIQAPRLKEVSLLCDLTELLSPLVLLRCDPESVIGEIEKLNLVDHELEIEQYFDLCRPCPLNHVKEMSLRVAGRNLTGLDALLSAASCLETFRLSFAWLSKGSLVVPMAGLKHLNLQKIQVNGFCCSFDHLQLLKYLVGVVFRLENMEMTIRGGFGTDAARVRGYIKKDIEDKLPQGAKLVILPSHKGLSY